MPTERNYRIDEALQELSLVRNEIVGILNQIKRNNKVVIKEIREVKQDALKLEGIERLDVARQLDLVEKDVELTNQYIDSLLS